MTAIQDGVAGQAAVEPLAQDTHSGGTLRVLHVVSGDLWAGAEVQAFTLMTMLQSMGVEVHAALMNEGELAARLRSRGIPVTVIDERTLNGLDILLRLRALIREIEPTVVHTHRTKENVLGSLANLLSKNVPCLRTVHGAPEHKPRALAKRLTLLADRMCGRYLQRRIIAVSSELKQRLQESYPPDKIVVIQNGIDVGAVRERIHPVEFRAAEDGMTHIGIVGRLVPVKRVDLFLEMASLMQRSRPQRRWRFHIFGDGPLRRELEDGIRARSLGPTTTLHGHREDVIACIAALDVLVICSDHEGLPMNALEALAVGTPIVAHAVGGLVEALSSVPFARLVPSQNPDDYAAAIDDMLTMGKAEPNVPPHLLASTNAEQVRAAYLELAQRHRQTESI